MFNSKQRQINTLIAKVEGRDQLVSELVNEKHALEVEIVRLNEQMDALEKTAQPAYDMNLLMGAILDYRKLLARLHMSDPVWARAALQHLFQKYNVKDDIRHPSEIRRLGRG